MTMGSQAQPSLQSESKTMILPTATPGFTTIPSGVGGKGDFPLARQSSIYSMTLDEFQSALGEPGKNFGSMNMDEFLKNIWTAEESQAMAAAMGGGDGTGGSLGRQQSLQRQGSLSLLRTLSRKTVDEVWKDIYREGLDAGPEAATSGGKERQATFGEMTLEDFLVKAGVVREEIDPGGQSFTPFGVGMESDFATAGGDRNGDRLSGLVAGFGERGGKGGNGEKVGGAVLPTLSLSPANALPGQAAIDPLQLDALKHVSPTSQQTDWLTNQYRSAMAQQQQQHILQQQAAEAAAAAYANMAKRVGNGALVGPVMGSVGGLGHLGGGLAGGLVGGGLGVGLAGGLGLGPTALGLGTGSPQSPISDGVGHSHDVSVMSPMPYGLDEPLRGRKRGLEGPVEKVVERRQRRMIKNRESAARSRARKQAYTVELEAEVTQLKEENMRLRKQQEEMAENRKKQILEVMATFSQKLEPKTKVLRRTQTGPW